MAKRSVDASHLHPNLLTPNMTHDTIETPINFSDRDRRKVVIFKGRAMQPWRARRILDNKLALDALNKAKLNQKDAAKRMKISLTCFRHWVNILQIKWINLNERGPYNRVPKDNWKETITEGLRAGKTQAEIAKDFGVHVSSVCRYCQENGIMWATTKQELKTPVTK